MGLFSYLRQVRELPVEWHTLETVIMVVDKDGFAHPSPFAGTHSPGTRYNSPYQFRGYTVEFCTRLWGKWWIEGHLAPNRREP